MRKEKLRHAVSMMLACVMAISGMAMYFPSCAEEQPEPDSEINTEAISEEAAETEPVKYLVTLPFFDGCSYVYPEENRKEEKENKDIILAYPPGESVEITLIPSEGIRVCEVHVTDCDQAEIGFSFASGEGKVSFLMPEKDVRLSPVTEEIIEETEESADADEDLPEAETLSASDAETAAGEIPALEEEQTEVSEEGLQEQSLPETEPETDPDGLPLQGSVVMTAPITLPFDTWQFDPETDFTNLTYDESQFTISYVSDDIAYDAAGTYSSIYRVTENESGKFWFALRPVLVSEEAETAETESAETESAAGEAADPAEQGTDQADPETAGSDPGEPSADEEPAEEETEKEIESFLDKWCLRSETEGHSYHSKRVDIVRQLMIYMLSLGIKVFVPKAVSRGGRSMPHIFTEEELQSFFYEVDSAKPKPHREEHKKLTQEYRGLFRLLYCCGLRNSEGCGIATAQVDLENGILTILNSKGNKDRLVYMSGDLTELCSEYYRYLCGELKETSEWFFPGIDPKRPLPNSSIDGVFNQFWERTPFSAKCNNKPTGLSVITRANSTG